MLKLVLMCVLVAPLGCTSTWELLHEVEAPQKEVASPRGSTKTIDDVKDLIDDREAQHAEGVHRPEQAAKSED